MEFVDKKQVLEFLKNFDDQYSKLIKDLKKLDSEITLDEIENCYTSNYGKKTLVDFMSQLECEVSIKTEEDFPDYIDSVMEDFDRNFHSSEDLDILS